MIEKLNAILLEKNGIKDEEIAREIIALCYSSKPRVELIKRDGLYYIVQILE